LASELVGLGYFGDEEREGLVAGAGLDLVDAIDGAEIDGVDCESVEGVGGESDDITAVEAVGDVGDERRLGFVGMDSESFCGQVLTPRGRGTPDLFAQSIQSLRLKYGLRKQMHVISMQSLQDRLVDYDLDGTFFSSHGSFYGMWRWEWEREAGMRIKVRFVDGPRGHFEQGKCAGEAVAGGVCGAGEAQRWDGCD